MLFMIAQEEADSGRVEEEVNRLTLSPHQGGFAGRVGQTSRESFCTSEKMEGPWASLRKSYGRVPYELPQIKEFVEREGG